MFSWRVYIGPIAVQEIAENVEGALLIAYGFEPDDNTAPQIVQIGTEHLRVLLPSEDRIEALTFLVKALDTHLNGRHYGIIWSDLSQCQRAAPYSHHGSFVNPANPSEVFTA